MAGADRMTIEEVVKRVLLDEHADVIREAVKAVESRVFLRRHQECPYVRPAARPTSVKRVPLPTAAIP